MAISLRVVGIFYRSDVELPSGGSVKDVLDAASAQITPGNSFSYSTVTTNGMTSPNMFRAFYEASFKSGSSGIEYPSGEYMLAEDLLARPAYSVWQYYIFDADGKFINRDKGFVPFDDSANARVEDGQSVTWRLVNVLAEPTTRTAPRLVRALTS
ncbi:hypothetical protein ABVF61_31470 [Roseibium sp. HPY-6]|uniref:hypothetical protein n=1 Tax=Roseibium sp. HPY-6 TaxID=3229852 RepID=UPI00338F8374